MGVLRDFIDGGVVTLYFLLVLGMVVVLSALDEAMNYLMTLKERNKYHGEFQYQRMALSMHSQKG